MTKIIVSRASRVQQKRVFPFVPFLVIEMKENRLNIRNANQSLMFPGVSTNTMSHSWICFQTIYVAAANDLLYIILHVTVKTLLKSDFQRLCILKMIMQDTITRMRKFEKWMIKPIGIADVVSLELSRQVEHFVTHHNYQFLVSYWKDCQNHDLLCHNQL